MTGTRWQQGQLETPTGEQADSELWPPVLTHFPRECQEPDLLLPALAVPSTVPAGQALLTGCAGSLGRAPGALGPGAPVMRLPRLPSLGIFNCFTQTRPDENKTQG